jgi:GNAT superfamily N-acetyltransferase
VPDSAELLRAYDAQLRTHVPERLPDGVTVEHDGPVLRYLGLGDRGFVLYRDLEGREGAAVDELIARQVQVFGNRGGSFEWKLHGHDEPADLTDRLRAAGFVPEAEETIMVGLVGTIAAAPQLPEGVSLRDVTARADLERIAALEDEVTGEDHRWLAANLDAELDADPDALAIVVAEAEDTVVCAGWVRFERGTDFATLWGGATLPAWRSRGIYRATVAYRANLGAERGFRFLQVDASSNSRPILERLGFTGVTTTTPYVWSPPSA